VKESVIEMFVKYSTS